MRAPMAQSISLPSMIAMRAEERLSRWSLGSRVQRASSDPVARSRLRRAPSRALRFALRKPSGFTLLEVLIALLVLALALVALARTAALQVENFAELRERTLADWLAQQVLAETRLANALPDPARSSGQRRYGGRDWHWELEIQATQVPTIRRLDVHVATAAAPAQPVALLTGFTGADLAH
ncbi:MAG: type II secretion system protein GspI [Gammaproteobacteria bacterium]|nr:MAG: type II secretion system protein GspI [Gammaproteobacteria bacterium]